MGVIPEIRIILFGRIGYYGSGWNRAVLTVSLLVIGAIQGYAGIEPFAEETFAVYLKKFDMSNGINPNHFLAFPESVL